MKKLFFAALVATVAVGGAFASQNLKGNAVAIYTYYEQGACSTPITCDDANNGTTCSIAFSGTTLYDQTGCNVADIVTSPLGKLPL